jgi:hypothetical protein
MSEPTEKVTNQFSMKESSTGPTFRKGDYTPDYKKNEGSYVVTASAFAILGIALVIVFNMKVSKDKVIYAEQARLVGIAKTEEIKNSKEAYTRIATNYAGYVYTRGPEGITRKDMLPYICDDQCRRLIEDAQTTSLRDKQLSQTVLIRSVDVVKSFKTGMEVRIEAVLRQSSTNTTRKSVEPPTELNVVIHETLEYTSRVSDAGEYPFLLTAISIETLD